MENRFKILMEQIKMPRDVAESNVFQTAEITKVEVHTASKRWEMELTFDTMLPVEVYKTLTSLIEAAFCEIATIDIFINVRDTTIEEELLNDYYQLALLTLNPSFTSIFKKYKLEIREGNITVRVEDLPTLDRFVERDLPQVEEKFRAYGFSHPKISYKVDDAMTQKSLAAHEVEVQQMLDDAIAAQAQVEALKAAESSAESHSVSIDKASKAKKVADSALLLGRQIKSTELATPMRDVSTPENNIVFEGYVFKAEKRDFTNRTTKKTSTMLELGITDYTSSFIAQKWARQTTEAEQFERIVSLSKQSLWVRVKGSLEMDNFKHELVLKIQSLQEISPKNLRKDTAADEEKRVEFHAHTAMSTMDALPSATSLVEQAAKWGHKALAITDHGGLQSFPEAHQAGKKAGIKIIYGVEINLVEDRIPIVYNETSADLHESTYVVFDVESTGLSAKYNKLIQIAAVKMHKGNVIEEYDEFLNPGHPLSQFTTELTGITDDHVAKAKPLKEVLTSFQKFCEGSILVAHNAAFDVGFLNMNYSRNDLPIITQPVIDTLELARNLHPELKRHGLGPLTKHFAIGLEHHHMANFDAEATGRLLFLFLEEIRDKQINQLKTLNEELISADSYKKAPVKHATLYALTQKGMKNLFKLVSYSNVNYFEGIPRIPKSVLKENRQDILVGSACEKGEVFEALTNKTIEETLKVAKFYDFIEIQPPSLYQPLIATEMLSNEKKLQEILKHAIEVGEQLKIPVLATGNAHYLHPEEKICREIIVRGLGAGNPINRPIGHGEYAQPAPLPNAHFRTTDEMLAEFKFLGKEKAYEIAVKNTQMLADRFDELSPVRQDLYTPYIEGAEEDIVRRTYKAAHKIYGDPLPDIIDARLEKELRSIVGNGFSVIYLIAQQLVQRSNDRGYLVGSRGSVGSSLVATIIGITEVNPLPPHYICSNRDCKHFEVYDDGLYKSGFDMPDKNCPDCHRKLVKDGQDIPFETFLGFKGDKVPDIDLNFSGDDQPCAHLDVRDIFGEDYAFRAGTIGTVAEKTAFGFVKGYARDYGKMYREAEVERLVSGATGVKRTTGQHPGGIIVIPNYMDIYDFSPVQYPADDTGGEWKTTHFDFHAVHDNILKLDILGHDDPTMIRKLQSLSGIDPIDIPMSDKDVLKLFIGTESLGITEEQAMTKLGTLGIPEMGTYTSMAMISEAKPKSFADLLQISGLSHGTDVWKGNAQDLIKKGIATLSTVIGCRDDIMTYLIHKGCDQSIAFKIMEVVRKGNWTKISEGERENYITEMKNNHVPDWYIESCAKIKYMFPKAHAAAYIMMALRVAWFKVHRPMDYYCAWFSIRATAYDIVLMSGTLQGIKEKIKDIRHRSKDRANPATKLEQDLLVTLELCNEMRERGFKFGKIDLYESQADEFIIDNDTLIPPFKVMDGLGAIAAQTVVAAREKGNFLSKNDIKTRTKLTQTNIEQLGKMGALEGLPEDNQLSLFDL